MFETVKHALGEDGVERAKALAVIVFGWLAVVWTTFPGIERMLGR